LNKNAAASTATGTCLSRSTGGTVTRYFQWRSGAGGSSTRLAFTNALDLQTPTSFSVLLTGRSQQAVQHLFKLLLQQSELGGLVVHCSELSSDQRQQTRAQGQAWLPIEANNHCFDVTKRQAQRAGPSDEAQLLHAGLIVLSISGCRAARGRQHANLFVVANGLGRHASSLCELTDGESLCHRLTSLFDMGCHDKPSSRWKVKENLGRSYTPDPVVLYARPKRLGKRR